MNLNNLLAVTTSAKCYAEGCLSSGRYGFFLCGWRGARYEGYPIWQRPIKALIIARDMRSRGLFPGFNINSIK